MSGQLFTSFVSFSWILFLCLITMAKSQVRVIGASEPVTAQEGDTVLLPCRCEPAVDLTPLTVEWTRVQHRTDPSDQIKRREFVHTYPDPHKNMDMKISDVMNRTELFPDQFRAGNASLLVHHLTLFDNGMYTCYIPKLRTAQSLRRAQVALIVRQSDEDITTTPPALQPALNWTELDNGSRHDDIWVYIIVGLIVLLLVKDSCKADKETASQPVRSEASEEQSLASSAAGQSVTDIELVLINEPEPRPAEGTLQASDAALTGGGHDDAS